MKAGTHRVLTYMDDPVLIILSIWKYPSEKEASPCRADAGARRLDDLAGLKNALKENNIAWNDIRRFHLTDCGREQIGKNEFFVTEMEVNLNPNLRKLSKKYWRQSPRRIEIDEYMRSLQKEKP